MSGVIGLSTPTLGYYYSGEFLPLSPVSDLGYKEYTSHTTSFTSDAEGSLYSDLIAISYPAAKGSVSASNKKRVWLI